MEAFVFVAVLAACVVWAVRVAQTRGYSATMGVVLGLVLGVFGVLALYVLPDQRTECRRCKSRLNIGAVACAACGCES